MTRFRFTSATLLAVIVCCCSMTARAQSVDRAQVEKEVNELWEQIRLKEPLLLDTSSEDKAAWAKFLAQPDTGLIRLLPREKYDYDHKLPMRGGGSYYSFTRRTQEYGHGSDLSLEANRFGVGFAGFDFGLLFPLGDLPLKSINLEIPVIKALVEFEPPTTQAEARAQQSESSHPGTKLGPFTYFARVDARVGQTYALRSINYGRSDVLVAFHVIRKDEDGSLILVWQTLKTFAPPLSLRRQQD